jgi:hypothetical protein
LIFVPGFSQIFLSTIPVSALLFRNDVSLLCVSLAVQQNCATGQNEQRGERKMKKLALGVATAAVLLTAAPAMAQVGFYAGPHGFGVGVGAPYYGYDYPYTGYYDYYDGPDYYDGGPNVVIRGGHYGHGHHYWRH